MRRVDEAKGFHAIAEQARQCHRPGQRRLVLRMLLHMLMVLAVDLVVRHGHRVAYDARKSQWLRGNNREARRVEAERAEMR
jgi:hypothetical protein